MRIGGPKASASPASTLGPLLPPASAASADRLRRADERPQTIVYHALQWRPPAHLANSAKITPLPLPGEPSFAPRPPELEEPRRVSCRLARRVASKSSPQPAHQRSCLPISGNQRELNCAEQSSNRV
jgi:hypothetical protein